jgi:hypothetical protein
VKCSSPHLLAKTNKFLQRSNTRCFCTILSLRLASEMQSNTPFNLIPLSILQQSSNSSPCPRERRSIYSIMKARKQLAASLLWSWSSVMTSKCCSAGNMSPLALLSPSGQYDFNNQNRLQACLIFRSLRAGSCNNGQRSLFWPSYEDDLLNTVSMSIILDQW